jgi:PAS domain S-box-containing protein
MPAPALDELLGRAAIGIALLDTSGRYLHANEPYARLLGRTAQALPGVALQALVHPEDLPATLDAFIRVIESGEPRVLEQRWLRADGSAVRLATSVSVARDAGSHAEQLLLLAHEVKGAPASPLRAQAEFRLLLDSAAEGIYCVDREGKTTLCNAAFLRMLGFQREEDALGKDLHELIHHSYADGTPYPRERCPVHKAAQLGQHAHVKDELYFRIDRSSFPIEYWVRPIERMGAIEGAVCTFIDATERKQAEARQQLLNREMAHRMKNTLAMVQAIVAQSLRNAATPRDAMVAINQRLVALGHAHTALARTRWGNASIMDVIEGAISAHRASSARVQLNGPRMDVGAKAALGLTLALHELCTNAAKYGALSNDAGAVSIDWSISGGAADARFRLTWSERGGPPVKPPSQKGFGSRLVGDSVASDLKGEAQLSFAPSGVVWTLQAPLTAVKESF